MAYVERTTQSWGSKIGDGFKAIIAGIVLIIAATVLLFWNEGRAVKTADCINEAEKVHVELGDISQQNTELNGKLVYAKGDATTKENLTDPRFNINVNALALRYSVQYYQWVEHKSTREEKKVGGSTETITTYTYSKDWVPSPVNSSGFKEAGHNNTTLTIIDADTVYAQNVEFGAYKLPDFLYKSISAAQPLEITFDDNTYAQYAKALVPHKTAGVDETGLVDIGRSIAHITSNNVYFGNSEGAPEIGDVRVTITHTPPSTPVSLVAQLDGNTFVKYTGKSCKDGYEYSSIYDGTKSASEVFAQNRTENTFMTWILRLVGFLLVFAGFNSFFKLGEALLDVLPFLGNIFGFAGKIIAGLLAIVWSFVIIAIAWLFYRPLLSITLLVIAGAIIFFIIKRKKQKTQDKTWADKYKQPQQNTQPQPLDDINEELDEDDL